MRVVLTSAARRDRREAEVWYRNVSPEAALRFASDLRAALDYIGAYPRGAVVFEGAARGKTMTRFPFTILYQVLSDRIRVVAIADERRRPGSYADRL